MINFICIFIPTMPPQSSRTFQLTIIQTFRLLRHSPHDILSAIFFCDTNLLHTLAFKCDIKKFSGLETLSIMSYLEIDVV